MKVASGLIGGVRFEATQALCDMTLKRTVSGMEIEFDPAKSERNLRERGFDFAFASRVFLGQPTIFEDTRRDYGETRMIAIGEIDGRLFKVVFHRPRERPPYHLCQPRQPTGEAPMAARMTLNEAAASGRVDLAKVDATTEDDIARFHIEDSLELDETVAAPAEVLSPAEIRRRLGLTQAQLAERLDVPLRTWRNWEQGRVTLEPTVRVLLKLLSVDPEDVLPQAQRFPARASDGGARQPPRPRDRCGGHGQGSCDLGTGAGFGGGDRPPQYHQDGGCGRRHHSTYEGLA